MALNEITAYRRHVQQRAHLRLITFSGTSRAVIGQKLWPSIFAGTQKNRVGMFSGFIWKRCNVQSSKDNVSSVSSIMIGNSIGTVRGRNVDLNDHEVRCVVDVEPFDMFVRDADLIIRMKIGRQSRQAQRRKQ